MRAWHTTCLGLCLLATAFFAAESASAYCRTHTCKSNCEREDFCIVSGKALFWPHSCVSFAVQGKGSPKHGISAAEIEQITQAAFNRWLAADCGGGATPSIAVQSLGLVQCDRTEYNQDYGNANIFMFRDDLWPPEESEHALALTTVWFNPNTGSIYDADVEINGTGVTAEGEPSTPITIGTPEDGADLASILTHEIGHFLGLSHSRNGSAVMRPAYEPGRDDLRQLHADDIAGICAALPPERPVQGSSCTPRHGFASDCRKEVEGGCSVSAVPTFAFGKSTALGLFVLAFVGLRRRSARGSSKSEPS